jgi:hypothetical protein
MKKQKLILSLAFCLNFTFTLQAQIKVVTGGNVVLSRKTDPSAWVLIGETEQNLSKIYPLARFNTKAVNTLALTVNHEAFTSDVRDWVWVSASKSNYGFAKHWITILGKSHNAFTTSFGTSYASSFIRSSDLSIKKDIQDLSNALDIVKQLRGVQYNFIPEAFCGDSCDQATLDVAGNDRLHFGFIAQELESVVPNLTISIENGKNSTIKAIDYDEIIPLLVEAIKTQQLQIELLANNLSLCCPGVITSDGYNNKDSLTDTMLKKRGKTVTSSLASGVKENKVHKSTLFPNTPNPFDVSTTISYEIQADFKSAKLFVYNTQGNQILSYPINTSGKGSLEIKAAELVAGVYYYSLIVDNNEVGYYKMILTK